MFAGLSVALRVFADVTLAPSIPARCSAPPELQQVVRPANHLPLRSAVRQPAPLESVDPSASLGLAEHRLDDLAALLVESAATPRQQLAVHPLAVAQTSGDATARRLR